MSDIVLNDVKMWKTISFVLIGFLVVFGLTSLLLYSDLSSYEKRYDDVIESMDKISFSSDLLFNYGNGSKIWHNDTRLPLGIDLYNVTVLVSDGKINSTYYPEYKSHFITSIDGVGSFNDPEKLYWSWIAWYYDDVLGEWVSYDVSSDMVYPKNGDIIAWYFEDTSNYPDYTPPN